MATTSKRTVTIDELSDVLKRLNQESIRPEVIQRRRRLSAEANKVVDEMEPLEEDVKNIIRRQRGEKPIG
ncbi:MAG TPA: hypothetical protein VFZ25_04970 [Chloroflexota bacterium]|nr:hypothetical protein [Chloroflexota bacterium]